MRCLRSYRENLEPYHCIDGCWAAERWDRRGHTPFTSEQRPVESEVRGHLDDSEVCGDTVSGRENGDVTDDDVVGGNELLLPIAYDGGFFCNEGLDRLHDSAGVPVHESIECGRHDDDDHLQVGLAE